MPHALPSMLNFCCQPSCLSNIESPEKSISSSRQHRRKQGSCPPTVEPATAVCRLRDTMTGKRNQRNVGRGRGRGSSRGKSASAVVVLGDLLLAEVVTGHSVDIPADRQSAGNAIRDATVQQRESQIGIRDALIPDCLIRARRTLGHCGPSDVCVSIPSCTDFAHCVYTLTPQLGCGSL